MGVCVIIFVLSFSSFKSSWLCVGCIRLGVYLFLFVVGGLELLVLLEELLVIFCCYGVGVIDIVVGRGIVRNMVVFIFLDFLIFVNVFSR